ncbi:MAG: PilT/PilU family type 4a pilus ATPase [Verrucomicrobiota bacterium]|nr:PilT/PilU family type 4a pilus ATPase [Verrucomicrobiota bacterium]MDP7440528.1 PilT/PilU family type 4a pilus ATPase [Verrucomicrobiota bacterium]
MELFHKILKTAVDGGASDIHIKPDAPVVYRISSQLVETEMTQQPEEQWLQKVIDNIVPEHFKQRLEEDRELDFSYHVPDIGRFRTNCFQHLGKWCLAMRHVVAEVPNIDSLGLPEVIKSIAESHRGIVMVAGTTGCGKSTTLAGMINHINTTQKRHIITLEDPVEYVFEDNNCIIEQREIGLDTPSYTHSLKHIMRQDPDVIMIGEMRDATSFRAAMSAADTGHLVLSTLHTIDAPQSISRMLDFFPADERESVRKQMLGTIRAIIVQRMTVRKDGGVIPAIEIMINTSTVSKLINENRLEKLHAAVETGTDDGMQNFNQSLFQLVKDDIITKEEALEKATNAQALEMNFKGIFLSEGSRILS